MSFMSVAGTVYHCTKCASQLHVDYQGGAMMCQVSDPVIAEQQSLQGEFSQPPKTGLALLGSPQYLHAKIICEDCFTKMAFDDSKVNKLSCLLGEVDATVQQVVDQVRARCEHLTLSDLEEVIGKPMFGELSGRSMLPAKKRHKLNEIFQKWYCLDDFLSRCIKESLAGMPKPLPDKELIKFVTKLNKNHLTTYIPKDIGATECLNPFIYVESAVRVPLPSTPSKRVYYKSSISLPQFEKEDFLFKQIHECLSRNGLVGAFKNMALNHFVGPTV